MPTVLHGAWLKKLVVSLAALVLAGFVTAAADPTQQVIDAARSWLRLIDDGKYDQSWNEASKLFRERVTQAQWATEVRAAREPLGAVESRAAPTVREVTSLPGVPDARYAILEFHSKFQHKADAVETVTMVMDDGTWKPAGYFIK